MFRLLLRSVGRLCPTFLCSVNMPSKCQYHILLNQDSAKPSVEGKRQNWNTNFRYFVQFPVKKNPLSSCLRERGVLLGIYTCVHGKQAASTVIHSHCLQRTNVNNSIFIYLKVPLPRSVCSSSFLKTYIEWNPKFQKGSPYLFFYLLCNCSNSFSALEDNYNVPGYYSYN